MQLHDNGVLPNGSGGSGGSYGYGYGSYGYGYGWSCLWSSLVRYGIYGSGISKKGNAGC